MLLQKRSHQDDRGRGAREREGFAREIARQAEGIHTAHQLPTGMP